MNERIQQLIEQCTIDIETFDAEKFAELLQQDCLQHLTNTGQDHAREILERYFAGR